MTGLITHVVVKRLSFVVTLFGLQYFKVTSLNPCLKNEADNIVLEMADVMHGLNGVLPVDNATGTYPNAGRWHLLNSGSSPTYVIWKGCKADGFN